MNSPKMRSSLVGQIIIICQVGYHNHKQDLLVIFYMLIEFFELFEVEYNDCYGAETSE